MKRTTQWVIFAVLVAMPCLSWAQGPGPYYNQIDSLIGSQLSQPQVLFNSLYSGSSNGTNMAYLNDFYLVAQEKYGFSQMQASHMWSALDMNNSTEFQQIWSERYPSQSATAPYSVQTQVQLSTFQTAVFRKVEPTTVAAEKAKKAAASGGGGGPGKGLMKVAGTDLTLNLWKYDGGAKGWTAGVNPGITLGEDSQFSLNVPLYQTDIHGLPKEILTYGLDSKFKQKITDNFALGAHANFLQNYYGTGLPDKREASFSMGPFASFLVPVSDRVNLSFGGMLDYTDPEWSTEVWTGSLGANLGIKILDNLVTNPYFVYFRDLDRAKDSVDNDFWDVGIELKALLGESWTFTVGTKTTMGYVGYKAQEFYVGTSRQW